MKVLGIESTEQGAALSAQLDAEDGHDGQRSQDHARKVVDAPHRAEPHRFERHDPINTRHRKRKCVRN